MSGRHWREDMIEGNIVELLYDLGRWDEALSYERWSATSDLALLEGPLAEVHLARGDLKSALELQHASIGMDRDDQPQHKLGFAEVQVRLCLQSGRPSEALAIALAAAAVIHGTEDESEARALLLAGLEAAVVERAPLDFEQLVALLGGAVSGVTAAAVSAVVEAERSRVLGASDPELWLTAVREWNALGHPHAEAWARLRAADAMLAQRGLTGARARGASELEIARRTAEPLSLDPWTGSSTSGALIEKMPSGSRESEVSTS
jgi:hypothetical protein